MAAVLDPEKSARNTAERGLPFEHVEWETAITKLDTRRNYGEIHLQVLGMVDGHLHAVVVTPRDGDLRVIGFRKANGREVRAYEAGRRSGLAPGR